MKKPTGRARWLGMVILVAASVFAAETVEEKMAVHMMAEAGESAIRVRSGKPFAIRFYSNPGTGYSWELAAKLDPKLLVFLGEKSEGGESGLLGGEEAFLWTFKALANGEAEISMKYVRPWEKGGAPAKKYVFKVLIEPCGAGGE